MMKAFSRSNLVNAVTSGVIGSVLSASIHPMVAQALQRGDDEPVVREGPKVIIVVAPEKPIIDEPPPKPKVKHDEPLPSSSGIRETGESYKVLYFVDRDDRGVVEFEAFVLTQNFRWKYGKADEVTYPTAYAIHDVPSYFRENLSYRLVDAKDVISIGMASCEGDRPGEEERSQTRAEMLNLWVQEARPDDRPRSYHIVNLGQFRKHDCNAGRQPGEQGTSDQRRIVVLYVTKKQNVESREDLTKRILRQLRANRHLLFDPADYSRAFTLVGARVKS